MATHEFYSTENHHNERQIRILSVGSLVSKPPTKEKRISIKVRMPLSGTVNMGAPAWIDEAYIYVGKHGGDKITPDIEFKGYQIELSTENLFGDDIKATDCMMRGFEIAEYGNEETPDVGLSFSLRISFNSKRWHWLGQYVGEDVWARFLPGEVGLPEKELEDGTLLDDGENDEDDLDQDNEEDAGEDVDVGQPDVLEYEDETPGKKHDAKELATYHENVVAMEQAPKAIRRPKGFAKPLHEGNEF